MPPERVRRRLPVGLSVDDNRQVGDFRSPSVKRFASAVGEASSAVHLVQQVLRRLRKSPQAARAAGSGSACTMTSEVTARVRQT